MSVNILSIGTAVPDFQIEQQKVFEFMSKAHGLAGKEKNRLKALYRASAIKNRYSVIPDYATSDKSLWQFYPKNEKLAPFPSTKQRNDFYREKALPLAKKATLNCLDDSKTEEITHLITVSCSGLYAPGLDIDLVNELKLNHDVERTCINFMGCYAAITGLKAANAICLSNPEAKVLMVCVELCTLHFQKENNEENYISNAIFADGAAAVLLSQEATEGKNLSIEKFKCCLQPNGHNEMAWNIGNEGFEMRLTNYVPDLIESGIGGLVEKLSAGKNTHFAIHPGGKKILDVAQKALKITKEDNKHAHEVLKNYGNMSSPTILFVIKAVWESLQKSENEEEIIGVAFGPGLTMESVLLRLG